MTAPSARADDKNAVASFSILGDIVGQVVGEHAEVATIVGPDADAHVHLPSVAQVDPHAWNALTNSMVYVQNADHPKSAKQA